MLALVTIFEDKTRKNEKFRVVQDENFESDFDKEVKRVASKSKEDKSKGAKG